MNREAVIESLTESILAARGVQVRRKDKDLMDDTGGVSKGRDREPILKPSRDDVKHRDRPKDKPAPERDRDTDIDKDTKSDSDTRDKDLKQAGFLGLDIPEPTYADRVASALVNIMADEQGVSEKSFDAYDALLDQSRGIVEANSDLVAQFEAGNARTELCAEVLYGTVMASSKNFLINPPVGRTANDAARANSMLAKFPQTFRALLQREG